ncbi:hypothetical protein ACFXKX_34955 [Streptomyces scopuliridis]|uniref:hypothetical protein n=1 Tax=Streptomyces scopuliridis TaxID=452529 RepID=UPI00367961A3
MHPDLLDAPWLEHGGHAAYTHHIPAGHDNLDALAHEPQLKALFTREQVSLYRAFGGQALSDLADTEMRHRTPVRTRCGIPSITCR